MFHSRRDFIKYVVAGSVAAGCPIERALLGEPPAKALAPSVEGEHFTIGHEIRDGRKFPSPNPSRRVDVVIIGGGVAGLSAGYFLRGQDWLLLEKEPHFGGNAYQEDYEGQVYGTGSAYGYRDDAADLLAKEIGLHMPFVKMPDPLIDNGVWTADPWRAGMDHLPYSKEAITSLKKFRDDVLKMDFNKRMVELDNEPFSRYTAQYTPELTRWWDTFGPSNWGATTADTSAFIGHYDAYYLLTGGDDQRVILPGGLGCITNKLVEVMKPKYGDRMLSDATVVSVNQESSGVRVTYLQGDQAVTVLAKVAILCTPKYITWRMVAGLPAEQKQAMRRMRYAPYPMINMIFDKPVYRRGYDNWCPGRSFTDFIVSDWTIRDNPGYQPKYNILTFYVPLREEERATLLEVQDCKLLAGRVLRDFQKSLPEFSVDPIEVRVYRRGHPMSMAVPGQFTKNRMIASLPMERIFFANSDSGGPESLSSEAVRISQAAAEWAGLILAGKPGAADLAHKALTDVVL